MKRIKNKNPDSSNPLPEMPVEKQLFRNLRRAHDSLHIEMFQLCKTFNITIAQFDLMETILFSPIQGLSIQELAKNTVSHQPNVTRSVGVLEKAGLVRCTKNNTDNRAVIVKLTDKGNHLITQVQKPLLELHYMQFEDFNSDELIQFNNFLQRITQSKNLANK